MPESQSLYILKKTYDKTSFYKSKDPEVALNMARKTTEMICQMLFQEKEPAKKENKIPLDKIIVNLKGIIPQHIDPHLRTIQNYSNYGSHYQNNHLQIIDSDYIEPCISALDDFIEWFYVEHLGIQDFATDDDFLIIGDVMRSDADKGLKEYEDEVREALLDSHLSEKEKFTLQSLRKIHNIPKEIAQDIYHRVQNELINNGKDIKPILNQGWFLTDREIKTLIGELVLTIKSPKDIYLGKNIPQNKLTNACNVCRVPSGLQKEIFFLIDMTLFGSATDVLLMGPKNIYLHNDGGSSLGNQIIPLTDFINASLDVKGDLIEVAKGKFFHVSIIPEIFSYKGFSSNLGAAEKTDIKQYLTAIQLHLKTLKGSALAQK